MRRLLSPLDIVNRPVALRARSLGGGILML